MTGLRWVILLSGSMLAALYAPPADACMAAVWRPQKRPPKGPDATAALTRGVLQVAVAHDGGRTTWTLGSEVKGSIRKFSLMIPVPAKVSKSQVRVLKSDALAVLDRSTAPRVERRSDPNPCQPPDGFAAGDVAGVEGLGSSGAASGGAGARRSKAADFGVKVESHIQVGGYDIAVLQADGAAGLAAWLRKFKYDVPEDVEFLMGDYLEHDWRFLVARVNLKKLARERFTQLQPLQIDFRSPQLELPIRLAGVSSSAPVDMAVFVLSDTGLATVKGRDVVRMPTDENVPAYAAEDLSSLHNDVVTQQLREHPAAVLLEYSGAPRSSHGTGVRGDRRIATARSKLVELGSRWVRKGKPLWVTRYRLRFSGDPLQDLTLQAGAQRDPFEVRYVARRPWQPTSGQPPDDLCPAGQDYLRTLGPRSEEEIATLVRLTGEDEAVVRRGVGTLVTIVPPPPPPREPVPEHSDSPDPGTPPLAPGDSGDGPRNEASAEPPAEVAELSSLMTRAALGLLFLMALLVGFGRWQRGR